MEKKKALGMIVLGASLIGLAYLIYKTQKTKATSQPTPTSAQPQSTMELLELVQSYIKRLEAL